MSGVAKWRCGHDRTQDNTQRNGSTIQCRSCWQARLEVKLAATKDRNREIVSRYLAGEDMTAIGADYGLKRERVRRILVDLGALDDKPYTVDPFFAQRALKRAAELSGATVEQLKSGWRAPKQLVHARWAFMVACQRRGASTPQIGKRINRDHSTVLYGLRQAEYRAERFPEFRALVAEIEAA